MRISVVLLLTFGITVSACDRAESTFPIEETLTQELMPLEGSTNPFMIEVKHPFLIILNSGKADGFFHFYTLADRSLKSVFGIKGESITESSTPWILKGNDFLFPILYNYQLPDLLIGDEIRRRIYRFGITNDGNFHFKENKPYSDSVENMSAAAFINDTSYVLDAEYQAPCLWLMSLNRVLPLKLKQYRNPEMTDHYADPDMGRVFANESRIALCYGWKKQIDFMDSKFKLLKSIKYKFDEFPGMTPENHGDIKASYVYGYFGKRYFYTIFFGASWNEHTKSFKGSTLEVYDLDGNPAARYKFDGISPSRFVVDETTFTLYGIIDNRYKELKNCLLVYNLTGL